MNKALRLKIVEVCGTQANFAQFVGANESVVSRVIRGRRQLAPTAQRKWARVLRCKPCDVFSIQDTKSTRIQRDGDEVNR